jgi:predicted nucleic acid-binding protein
VAFLVDTNVLAYRYDPRFATKQERAVALLDGGVKTGELRVPHQALVELVAVLRRPLPPTGKPLLADAEIVHEVEMLLVAAEVIYPTAAVLRLALAGVSAHQLSWFDAHLWAYAEHYMIPVLYSEDFAHDRLYGSVRVVNPFLD